MTSDPHGKSLSTDVLFPPRMDSSSTVVASLSSSSSKSRERPGDYLVEAIKRRRLEKGPASFRSLVDIAHAMVRFIYRATMGLIAMTNIFGSDCFLLLFIALWDI